MNSSRLYDRWKDKRSAVEVDDRFADRVIDEIRQCQPRRPSDVVSAGETGRGASHRFLVAALVVAGIVVGVLRVGSVIAFILFTSTEGL